VTAWEDHHDPYAWEKAHKPLCVFHCGTTWRTTVAKAWTLPGQDRQPGPIWLVTGVQRRTTRQRAVDDQFLDALMNRPMAEGYSDIAQAYAEAEPRHKTPYVQEWHGMLDDAAELAYVDSCALFQCPNHGRVLVPVAWVEDETRSTRSWDAKVLCGDPHPVYHERS
jgi:hypothetical protein